MSKTFALFFVALITLGLLAPDAEARRLGGGGNIGKQSNTTQKQSQPPAQAPAQNQAPATPPASGASKWLGPLAGLAAGAGLAALFMGEGAGGAFGSMLMVLALVAGVFFVVRMLRRPAPPAAQAAGTSARIVAPMPAETLPAASAPYSAPAAAPARGARPPWFEDAAFAREAKKHFIRLQDANDRGDLADIREFVTPEMYAEISLQIQERAGRPNKTEVVTLNADIADVVTEGDLLIATVRFAGTIREEIGAAAESFAELWHVQKPLSLPDAPWLVAGIQQVA